MVEINRKIQALARRTLRAEGWGEDSIQEALNPTPEQAEERGYMPTANVNPEQHTAIRYLHRLGWGSHAIAQAIPVAEREIARVLQVAHDFGGWEEREE